jgi:hypothetical protein
VNTELTPLFGATPAMNPITTGFTAVSSDPMDQMLANLMEGLRSNNKDVRQAAQEVAQGALQVNASSSCRPGVLAGFKGKFDDVPIQQVPLEQTKGPGGTSGGPVGGGGGYGSGPGLGQFRNAVITVKRSDGTDIGQAVTDSEKGMVTIVPCQYRGPVRITVTAKPDGASTYFDETTGEYAGYPTGTEMNAVVPAVQSNMGVTLLTEAAWQYLLAKHGEDGWKDMNKVKESNQFIRDEFNKFLPKSIRIEDITNLPFLVSKETKQDTLTTSKNDIYGLVSSGLARAAGLMRKGDPAPALKLVKQLGKDLSDGVIDLYYKDKSGQSKLVVDNLEDAAYLPRQLPETLNRGIGEIADQLGKEEAKKTTFRVTQMSINPVIQSDGKLARTYTDQHSIVLLDSNGKLFRWKERRQNSQDYILCPISPESSFSRLFPQTAYDVAAINDGTGDFMEQILEIIPRGEDNGGKYKILTPTTVPDFKGATTTAGYRQGVAKDTLPRNAQITRMPDSSISYFPHYIRYRDSFSIGKYMPHSIPLKASSIGISFGGNIDNQPGDDPTGPTAPTFYAVTEKGEVFAWGNKRLGALGDGNAIYTEKLPLDEGTGDPIKVVGLEEKKIVSVIGRESGAFAIDTAGDVWGWGGVCSKPSNQPISQGLLTNKNCAESAGISKPEKIDQFKQYGPIRQISCGTAKTCIALTRGDKDHPVKLLAWGDFEGSSVPSPVTEVPLSGQVTYIGASQYMVYAVMDDGQLVVFPDSPNNPKLLINASDPLPATVSAEDPNCQIQ